MTAYAGGYRDPTDVLGPRGGAYLIDGLVNLVLTALVAVGIFLLLAISHGTVRASDAEASAVCDRINDTQTTTRPGVATDSPSSTNADRLCIPIGDKTYVVDFGDLAPLYFVGFVGIYAASALNTVLLQGLKGGTVGKLAVGLRVVREDGNHAGIGWCALRSLLLVVDGQCLIGVILVCTTKGHRRLGDMAAGTFVVRKADVGQPVLVPGLNAPAYGYPSYGYPSYGSVPPAGGSGGWGGGYGYGAPPQPSAQSAVPGATADGPHWDADRNAYLHYDRDRGAWLQWDEARREWGPIDQ
jgi:uncharacterized RDD family membrane protein YckC